MAIELGTNLSQDASAGAWMTLRDPRTNEDLVDADGKPGRLKLAGKDSAQWRQASDANQRRALEDIARGRKYKPTPESTWAAAIRLWVAITLDWENLSYAGETAFSPELIRQFYDAERWSVEQVEEFISDRAIFSRASKTA